MNGDIKVYQSGSGKEKVEFKAELIEGRGIAVCITGGQSPHVGAVSLAFLENDLVTVSSITVPGHKDFYVAESVARLICSSLKQTASVTAGLHIDNASQEEIEALCRNAVTAAKEFIKDEIN